jgi:hypothetical protein
MCLCKHTSELDQGSRRHIGELCVLKRFGLWDESNVLHLGTEDVDETSELCI